ncbi:tRNA synthetases class I (C) catalytic domain-containing protein [Aspergillus lucknowensis]|uniref:tRNA synthetases class I (C) catalytic domain-containing protein n=1 Tax=Aspergillus lucknowensis TaxID=176173 RepID=A0ABR4LGA2_9EURO
MDSCKQPHWEQPPAHPSSYLPPITVWNSLTRSKTSFIPLDPARRKVTWCACGPTVYDNAYLGHARNYMSTNILCCIMMDHFQFDVHFVMNITNVDDKIILRGRQQYLFAKYLEEHPTITRDVLYTAQLAYSFYIRENLPLIDHDTDPEHFLFQSELAYGIVLRGGALDPEGKPGDAEAKI